MVFTIYFFFIIHFWDTFQDSFQMELPQKKKKKKRILSGRKDRRLILLSRINSIRTPKYTYSKDKQIIFIRSTHVITCVPSWETTGEQVWDAVSCFSNGGLFRNRLISSDFCWSWSTEKKISRLKWSLAYIQNLMSYYLLGVNPMLFILVQLS